MITIISFLIPLGAVFLLIPLFRKLAFKLNVVDIPGRRKIHDSTTPRMGGIVIYLGFVLGLAYNYNTMRFFLPILVGSTIILVLGFLDDVRGLSAQIRILWQVVAALIVVGFGLKVTFLPVSPWGDLAEIIITLIWIIGLTNAYNYLDGMDGLACGSAVINLLSFAIILYVSGQYALGVLALILTGACLGFLPHNLRKQKMFLGDAGSTFIGFTLACIGLQGDWAGDNIVKISVPLLILGVPIFDMIFTTITRVKEGKVKTIIEWLKYGGKDHFHHYLVDLGLMPQGAVIFIYFVTLSLGLSAIMLSNDRAIEAFLTILQASIILGIIATLIVVGKRRRSGWHLTKNP
jgi:UDP-GlcNAc:undecaprenyl-phosphate GlcNAc-1-phosphate transferase